MSRCIGLTLLTIVLSSCATPLVDGVGTQVASAYRLPANYAAHRAQQQYFSSDAGRMAYTDHGPRTGPALVLLHGVPTSSWMYRKMIPQLQPSMRVISVDLMGYGSSDKPADDGQLYHAQNQAQRVLALLSQLGVREHGLLMHDMGGLVAWEILRADVDAVRQLVVLNTIVREQGFNHPNFKPGVFSRQMSRAYANKLTSAAVLKLSFDNLGLSGDYKLSEAECFGYVEPMREGADQALYAFFTHLDDTLFQRLNSNSAIFSRYQGDTLILWGGRDDILTPEQIPFLTEHLRVPAANVQVYPDHQHFLAEEIPDQLARRIIAFMGTRS